MKKPTPEEQALWPSPNFDNPDHLHAPIIGVTITTFLLALLFLCTRILSKKLFRKTLEADDYLMLAAVAVALPMSIFPLVCLNLGLGLHVWDQKPEWGINYAKLGLVSDILFPIACSLTKASQCLSYLRLFPGRSNEIFCHTMILFITTFMAVCVLIVLLQCRPIRAHWDPETGSECMNMRATLAAIAALNSFSDLMIYLRPMKPLLVLQMPAKQRWGLMTLLAISLLPCVAGLLRLYYVEVFFDSVDELWNASIVWVLMMLEMNLGVMCGCLFGIQPVLAMLFPRLFASSYPSDNTALPPSVRRQESGHPESQRAFQAYPLADLSGHAYNTPSGEEDTFEALWTPEGAGSNQATASSGGRQRGELLTPGIITVCKEFTMQEEITPCQSPVSELDRQLHLIAGMDNKGWTLDEVYFKD